MRGFESNVDPYREAGQAWLRCADCRRPPGSLGRSTLGARGAQPSDRLFFGAEHLSLDTDRFRVDAPHAAQTEVDVLERNHRASPADPLGVGLERLGGEAYLAGRPASQNFASRGLNEE